MSCIYVLPSSNLYPLKSGTHLDGMKQFNEVFMDIHKFVKIKDAIEMKIENYKIGLSQILSKENLTRDEILKLSRMRNDILDIHSHISYFNWSDDYKKRINYLLNIILKTYCGIIQSHKEQEAKILRENQKCSALNKLIQNKIKENFYSIQKKEEDDVEELCITKRLSE